MASSHLKILDTREFESLTGFCGSTQQDTVLARHFWMSVQLQPHIESRLVSSDIKQRLRTSSGKKGSRDTEPVVSRQYTEIEMKSRMMDEIKKEEFLARFNERKQQLQKQFTARRWKRIELEDRSGQTFQRPQWFQYVDTAKTQEKEAMDIALEVQEDIATFEEKKTDL